MPKKQALQKSTNQAGYLAQCGVLLDNAANGQLRGDCPFCQKQGHFYCNPETGQYQCKAGACGTKGNRYTFLQDWHSRCLESTSEADYNQLSDLKKLPVSVLKTIGLAKGLPLVAGETRWLWLLRNEKQKPVNMLHYSTKTNKAYSTEACKLPFVGLDSLSPEITRPVWICEGVWDYAAWLFVLSSIKKQGQPLSTQHDLLAVLGADNFDKEAANQLQGRDIRLLYDNDAAGQRGMQKLAQYLLGEADAKSVRCIQWPSETPDKFDLRDLFTTAATELHK